MPIEGKELFDILRNILRISGMINTSGRTTTMTMQVAKMIYLTEDVDMTDERKHKKVSDMDEVNRLYNTRGIAIFLKKHEYVFGDMTESMEGDMNRTEALLDREYFDRNADRTFPTSQMSPEKGLECRLQMIFH